MNNQHDLAANRQPGQTRRFAPLDMATMSDDQRAAAQTLIDGPRGKVPGPFGALLRNPKLADQVRALGDVVRFESTLPVALQEFVVLIVARFWSARFEWHAHSIIAAREGVDAAIIDALAHGRKPERMTRDQDLLYRFCSELLYGKDVSDSVYAEAIDRFGETTLLDVLSTAGYFCFVSLILNAVRFPVPTGGNDLPSVAAI